MDNAAAILHQNSGATAYNTPADIVEVGRSTILRDLRIVEGVLDEAKAIQAKLRSIPITNTYRHAKEQT